MIFKLFDLWINYGYLPVGHTPRRPGLSNKGTYARSTSLLKGGLAHDQRPYWANFSGLEGSFDLLFDYF